MRKVTDKLDGAIFEVVTEFRVLRKDGKRFTMKERGMITLDMLDIFNANGAIVSPGLVSRVTEAARK